MIAGTENNGNLLYRQDHIWQFGVQKSWRGLIYSGVQIGIGYRGKVRFRGANGIVTQFLKIMLDVKGSSVSFLQCMKERLR